MTRRISSQAATWAVGILIAIGVINLSGFLWRKIPCWIGSNFPAVVVHSAVSVSRDADREGHGAFVLTNEKVASGAPLDPEFHAQGRNGAFSSSLGIAVHRCRPDGTPIYGKLPVHDLHVSWQTRYCFDMPSTFASSDELLIGGHLLHRRWFGEVRETVPEFVMCPVGQTLKMYPDGEHCA